MGVMVESFILMGNAGLISSNVSFLQFPSAHHV